jgi:hypothetical protein
MWDFGFKVLKALYGAFGVKHPQGSLTVVVLLGAAVGALVCGVVWQVARASYEKDQAATPIITAPITHVEAPGDCSSATSGNGNTTTISCDKPKEPPKK